MFRTDLFGETSAAAISAGWTDVPMIVDSFAGGGGASTGIEMALGRSPDIAINHNADALALHAANHPETNHISENVYQIDPLDHLRGKHIGLAWFSPDCKHFSKAKGGKPVERNIRDLCWIIPGWVERIQKSGGKVDVIIMENVEEFKDYGPLIETDRGLMPDPDRRGQLFEKWCKKLRRLGGKIEFRELRACDYGAPTIRKRLFVIIRFDGKPIVWPEPTHGKPADPDVVDGKKLPWRTAAECIDWSLACPSIFDTSPQIWAKHQLRAVRPLADATMARVARGMKRYVLDAERPFLVNLTHGGRLESADQPFNTITGAHRGEKAVVSPYVASYCSHTDGRSERTSELDDPLATIPTENRHALIAPSVIRFNTGATGQDAREPLSTVTANSFIKRPGGAAPLGVISPHLMTMRNAGKPFNGADEPTHTITAGGAGLTLVAPVLTAAQQGGSVRSVEDPHHTITASSKDQNAVIVPTLIGCGGRAGQSRPRGVDEPTATSTAKADGCVAIAFMAQHNNDSRRTGGVNPGRPADAPMSTATQSGSQQGVVSAFVARQFGNSTGHGVDRPNATVMPGGDGKSQLVTPYLSHLYTSNTAGGEGDCHKPIKTVTAGGNHAAMVTPYMQAYYGTGDGQPETEPTRTITTKDRHGHVEATVTVPPFTPEQAERAREVANFMRAHGFWDDREFVTVEISGVTFVIVDIGMRMLTPRELYNAQGFPPDYIIDGAHDYQADGSGPVWREFSKSVQVSCVGNSVSPPVACALVAANCGHLAVQKAAA
ncbi:C-5 cytosine-specific DNA methylase [Ensifer sp. Root142]|uniref:DNA cytosine methyltransferase n=1 Tax=Ensifer sp. Root142 TaxID=1736461 RepID=UPI00070D4984|nr:DNA cytosine methyltransferase [Ensifer sp. Root142]KQY71339.1 C-5 cytosine-specific DNA methylase [Ensifer sp. Root142]